VRCQGRQPLTVTVIRQSVRITSLVIIIIIIGVRATALDASVYAVVTTCLTATTSRVFVAMATRPTSAAAAAYSTTDLVLPTSSGLMTSRYATTPVAPAESAQSRSVSQRYCVTHGQVSFDLG